MAFAACSKSSSGSNPEPAPPATPPAASVSVEIKNFAFSASSVSIKKGGTVTWTNADSTPHTVTDNAGSFDSNSMATSATYSRKFETAGTYTYHCNFHSSMTGTVVVSN
ncbi:amidase [Mucilaginibacter phyllosphaerae]|nr:amidase [Mucilaginibacter phyllosphaerae]